MERISGNCSQINEILRTGIEGIKSNFIHQIIIFVILIYFIKNKFILMEDEIEDLQNRNELLEKDVEILRSRNSVLETRLTVDKNKLINNVII